MRQSLRHFRRFETCDFTTLSAQAPRRFPAEESPRAKLPLGQVEWEHALQGTLASEVGGPVLYFRLANRLNRTRRRHWKTVLETSAGNQRLAGGYQLGWCHSAARVQRAADAGGSGAHMGVEPGGAEIRVAEEFLNGADVVTGFEEVGREAVAEGVAVHRLVEGGGFGCLGDRTLDR